MTDLIRSSKLGSVEAITLFLEKDQGQHLLGTDAHVASRYSDQEGPSSRFSGTKRTKLILKQSPEKGTPPVISPFVLAAVQDTFKNERLKFDRLEPHAGAWIHATGDYTNGDGKTRRVAVTTGPEYGTVTPQQVKEAAKEAVPGVGFDILIVCGFAFDPHVSEEAKR